MRLQWCFGTLVLKNLKEKRKEINKHKLSNKIGEQSTGRQVLSS